MPGDVLVTVPLILPFIQKELTQLLGKPCELLNHSFVVPWPCSSLCVKKLSQNLPVISGCSQHDCGQYSLKLLCANKKPTGCSKSCGLCIRNYRAHLTCFLLQQVPGTVPCAGGRWR